MVGSAVVRLLESTASPAAVITATHSELDLARQREVEDFVAATRPDLVILAAATVGGIHANDRHPVEFLYDNLMIQSNVIRAAAEQGVSKLVLLGSSCIYPKFAPQPIPESALLTGALEETNQWYAVAKISGLKLCEAYRRQYGKDFISLMPTNLYGPGDNYSPEQSHVIPALLRKAHEAKQAGASCLSVWGSGQARREFLHVDDLARAILFLAERYSGLEHINVGSGEELSIAELAEVISQVVGFDGELVFDTSKPDGTPRKLLDTSHLFSMGWRPSIELRRGLEETYALARDVF